MTNYRVTSRAATINGGIVALTKEQAMQRLHSLRELGRGRYEVLCPIEFKCGEIFGYDGALPKALANDLDPAKKAKADENGGAD